jgi:hypothetical protein
MSTQPMRARSVALELQAMFEVARSIAATNASLSALNAPGSTVAFTSNGGYTLIQLYMGRPSMSGSLPRESHVPPIVTNAKISVVDGAEVRHPSLF